MSEYFVFVFMTIMAQTPFAVSSREPSQGLREVESFPRLAHPGAAPVRDVPCGDVEDSTHIQQQEGCTRAHSPQPAGRSRWDTRTCSLSKSTCCSGPSPPPPRKDNLCPQGSSCGCPLRNQQHNQTPQGKSPDQACVDISTLLDVGCFTWLEGCVLSSQGTLLDPQWRPWTKKEKVNQLSPTRAGHQRKKLIQAWIFLEQTNKMTPGTHCGPLPQCPYSSEESSLISSVSFYQPT